MGRVQAPRSRMNADIPPLRCFVRLGHISDQDGHEEAYAFAVQSVKGRSIGLHCMLKSGAHYRNVPLHAICLNRDAPQRELSDLCYWDCFTNRPVVTVFDYLCDHECTAALPSGKCLGVYLFTVDWLPDSAERPGFVLQPDQNKCAHVIALRDGNLAALPTNKIAWRDGYFIGADPHPELRGYKVQGDIYQAECASRDFSKSECYFY